MMDILIVVSDLPYPPSWGAAIRNYQLLRHLCASNRVTVLSYGCRDDQDRAQGLRALGAEVILVDSADHRLKRARQLVSIFSRRSYLGSIYHTKRMQLAINTLIDKRRPLVTLVEGSLLMRHKFEGTTVVLDEHNLEFEALERTAESDVTLVRRLYNRLEAAKFRREEIEAWRSAGACLFTSERELNVAQAMVSPITAVAVPNGVDLDYFRPCSSPVDGNSIVFTGRISYRPNTDAVHHFVDAVLPLIQAQRPDAVFSVVGADVPPSVAKLAGRRGVVITGRVPDVRPYLAKAAVVVAPIRFGSGTRLKVLEAMACARPIVSTSVGCEGIEVRAGEHLMTADSADLFADSVVRLMSDRELGMTMGLRGRHLVEQRYSWAVICERMEQFLVQMTGSRSIGPDHHPGAGPEPLI